MREGTIEFALFALFGMVLATGNLYIGLLIVLASPATLVRRAKDAVEVVIGAALFVFGMTIQDPVFLFGGLALGSLIVASKLSDRLTNMSVTSLVIAIVFATISFESFALGNSALGIGAAGPAMSGAVLFAYLVKNRKSPALGGR